MVWKLITNTSKKKVWENKNVGSRVTVRRLSLHEWIYSQNLGYIRLSTGFNTYRKALNHAKEMMYKTRNNVVASKLHNKYV